MPPADSSVAMSPYSYFLGTGIIDDLSKKVGTSDLSNERLKMYAETPASWFSQVLSI